MTFVREFPDRSGRHCVPYIFLFSFYLVLFFSQVCVSVLLIPSFPNLHHSLSLISHTHGARPVAEDELSVLDRVP